MQDTDRTKSPTLKGFSLLEVATVLVILTVITVLVVPLGTTLMSANRSNETFDEAARIYTAVVGDPSRNYYGYIGDTGQFPSSLLDLVRTPGVTGWNGPYVTDAHMEGGFVADPYGSAYECYYFNDNSISTTTAVADQFAIISRGPDLQSSNSATTSNKCTTYQDVALNTMPASYGQSGTDADNVVYPRFTDNPALLKYNHVGTLSITLFNFDKNSLINSLVPGCPHLYTVTITSVARSTDTFSFPYNPGAASVDLPQGNYKVVVTSAVTAGDVWQDQVTITPGASISRSANVTAYLDSSATSTRTFTPLNNYGATLTFFYFSTNLGNVANGGTGAFGTSPRACAQMYAQTALSTVVDAFVYPNLATAYTRRVSQSAVCTLTVLNRNTGNVAARKQVLVYDGGLFIGAVTSRGAYKSKDFSVRQGDAITIFDTSGGLLSSNTMGCPSNIPVS